MRLYVPVKSGFHFRPILKNNRSAFVSSEAGSQSFETLVQWLCAGFLSILVMANSSYARTSSSSLCDQAARTASAETGVPLSVLWAITRTETGRSGNDGLVPWPWTVNMEGIGRWFESESAAREYVVEHIRLGVRSVDIGCFQINYKWHGAAFQSIDHMFDPSENARYAAHFILKLYKETGDWSVAAGTYHSRSPMNAKRYRTRFDRIHAKHHETRQSIPPTKRKQHYAEAGHKHNNFPLLVHSTEQRPLGSLVPLSGNRVSPLLNTLKTPEGS